ncbi:MAG: 3-deoxy-D-manno-octulosonic acid transferase, partial [Candidatus Zixiibacteriota bacterium]
ELKIHISTMTRTGFSTATQIKKTPCISLSYFPFDIPSVVKKTLDRVQPRILVVAETEIWPNLVYETAKRNIPIILINGRMSEKAFGKYKLFRTTFKKILSMYDYFFFKTDKDASLYSYFDIQPIKWKTAGDMKFDAPLLEQSEEIKLHNRIQNGIDKDSFLFVAGSTRPGEELILMDVYKELSAEFDDFHIIIAPRHIERIDEIKAQLADKQIHFRMLNAVDKNEKMILVDKLGLLNNLYLAADISFVGGTLVDIGGHNILEPVWAGSPVIFGSSVHNVKEAVDYVSENNYGAMIKSKEELIMLLIKVHRGEIIFSTKKAHDLDNSPTALIGDFILSKLKNV